MRPSATGEPITPARAPRVPAVYGACKVLAESVAQLPLILYRRRADGGMERATDHPLYDLLHDQPNDWTSSYELRVELMLALLCHGHGRCDPRRLGLT